MPLELIGRPVRPIASVSSATPKPDRPLSSSFKLPRQLSGHHKESLADAKVIAERMQVNPRMERLERLLKRQSISPFELLGDRHSPRHLEHLAIMRRGDGRFAIAVKGLGQLLARDVFETVHHCTEAALELERTFAMGQYVDIPSSEAVERVEEIVRYHCWRERVELHWEKEQQPIAAVSYSFSGIRTSKQNVDLYGL
jgi:hypothetical protein